MPERRAGRMKWGRRLGAAALFLALGYALNLLVAFGSMEGLRRGWWGAGAAILSPQITTGIEGEPRYVSVLANAGVVCDYATVASVRTDRPFSTGDSPNLVSLDKAAASFPAWAGWDLSRVARDAYPMVIPARAGAAYSIPATAVSAEVSREFVASGLPFRSVLTTRVIETFATPSGIRISPFHPVANRGVPVVNFWPPSLTLGGEGYPLRPLFPGVLLNTALYAGALFALTRVPAPMRRRRRLAQNRCVRCGYSLRGLAAPACPECGRPLAANPPAGTIPP